MRDLLEAHWRTVEIVFGNRQMLWPPPGAVHNVIGQSDETLPGSSGERSGATIEAIKGEPLSGVALVQDYVEFHFDGMVVRSLTMPTVTVGRTRLTFPEPGSRDALCSLIGLVAQEIVIREEAEIEILFSGEASIHIPLGRDQRRGPEAAHFVLGPNQPLAVW